LEFRRGEDLDPTSRYDRAEALDESLGLIPCLLIELKVCHQVHIFQLVVIGDSDSLPMLHIKKNKVNKKVVIATVRVVLLTYFNSVVTTVSRVFSSVANVRPKSSTFPTEQNKSEREKYPEYSPPYLRSVLKRSSFSIHLHPILEVPPKRHSCPRSWPIESMQTGSPKEFLHRSLSRSSKKRSVP
jgi:hypothetical protein